MSLTLSQASKTHLSLKVFVTAMILPSSLSHLNSRLHDSCTVSMDINFHAINQEPISSRVKAYGYKLDSCINAKSFVQGKLTHGHMLVRGVVINANLGTKSRSVGVGRRSFSGYGYIWEKGANNGSVYFTSSWDKELAGVVKGSSLEDSHNHHQQHRRKWQGLGLGVFQSHACFQAAESLDSPG